MGSRSLVVCLALLGAVHVAACGGDVVGAAGVGDEWSDGGIASGASGAAGFFDDTGGGAVPGAPGARPRDGDDVISGAGGSSSGPSTPPSRPPSSRPPPPPPSTCGNGRLERTEQCDGRLLNGETCATATMNAAPVGTLRCSADCVLDVSGCYRGTGPRPGGWGSGGVYGGGGGYGVGGRPPIRRRPPIAVGGMYGIYPPPYDPPPPPYYPPPYDPGVGGSGATSSGLR